MSGIHVKFGFMEIKTASDPAVIRVFSARRWNPHHCCRRAQSSRNSSSFLLDRCRISRSLVNRWIVIAHVDFLSMLWIIYIFFTGVRIFETLMHPNKFF
jgi:hypothetical protein